MRTSSPLSSIILKPALRYIQKGYLLRPYFPYDSHALDVDLHWLQPFLVEITQHLLEEGIAPRTCFNINAPVGEIEGIRWTRQCAGHWEKELVPLTDELPEGVQRGFKLAGQFVNDEPAATDTDIWAMEHQLLSITPLSIDWTDYGSL